jgi:hypothetical protein
MALLLIWDFVTWNSDSLTFMDKVGLFKISQAQ